MRKVNITLDCVSDEQAYFLEQFLSDNYDNVSMQYLPDCKYAIFTRYKRTL